MSGRRKGFTLIELLVVIAIIAILAAILFPVFAKARDKARAASCQSNEKQILIAYMMYQQDYDERDPGYSPKPSWVPMIAPYVKNQQLFLCPSGPKDGAPFGYPSSSGYVLEATYVIPMWLGAGAWNWWGSPNPVYAGYPRGFKGPCCGWAGANMSVQESPRPAELGFLLEGYMINGAVSWGGCWCAMGFSTDPNNTAINRHNSGLNVGFGDGHVKWMDIRKLINERQNLGLTYPVIKWASVQY